MIVSLSIMYKIEYKISNDKVINMTNEVLKLNGYENSISEGNNIKQECHVENRYVYSFDYKIEGNPQSNRYVVGYIYDKKNNTFLYNYLDPIGLIDEKCINIMDNGTGETD